LTGAYAARRDNLLFLANDRALLDRLRNATKPDGASMREALRVDGEAANLLAIFCVRRDGSTPRRARARPSPSKRCRCCWRPSANSTG
jgi:hypothetical protein